MVSRKKLINWAIKQYKKGLKISEVDLSANKKLTKNQYAWLNKQKSLFEGIKRQARKGIYISDMAVPAMPKRISKKALNNFLNLTVRDFKQAGQAYVLINKETGELVNIGELPTVSQTIVDNVMNLLRRSAPGTAIADVLDSIRGEVRDYDLAMALNNAPEKWFNALERTVFEGYDAIAQIAAEFTAQVIDYMPIPEKQKERLYDIMYEVAGELGDLEIDTITE